MGFTLRWIRKAKNNSIFTEFYRYPFRICFWYRQEVIQILFIWIQSELENIRMVFKEDMESL